MQRAGTPAQTVLGGAILDHHGIRTDDATVADDDRPQDLRAGGDIDIIPNTRNMIMARPSADGHVASDNAVLPYNGTLMNDDTNTLVTENRALAYLRACGDERVVCLIDSQLIKTRQQFESVLIEPVGAPVLVNRIESFHDAPYSL